MKANYLPQALLNSAADCRNKCNNVLSAKIISGDTSAVSILASYIPNTSFSFSIEVNFAKEPIGMFVLQVGINPSLVSKYFQGIDTSSTISVNVNPAYFAKDLNSDNLTRWFWIYLIILAFLWNPTQILPHLGGGPKESSCQSGKTEKNISVIARIYQP